MYNRQHGTRRPPTPPQNYSGNAFYRVPQSEYIPDPPAFEDEMPMPPAEPACEEPEHEECESCSTAHSEAAPHKAPFPNFSGKLFPRGLGNEELLILALILMTSQSEDQNDILLYLILLLFC